VPDLDKETKDTLTQLLEPKREISATDIQGILGALERLSRGVWLESYGQVLGTFYDPTPATKDEYGHYIVEISGPTRNQQIVRSIIMVYDPGVSLLQFTMGQVILPFVPDTSGLTFWPLPFLPLRGGDKPRLTVLAGGPPSRLGLTVTGTEVPMGAGY
jgi:hypothetical protein